MKQFTQSQMDRIMLAKEISTNVLKKITAEQVMFGSEKGNMAKREEIFIFKMDDGNEYISNGYMMIKRGEIKSIDNLVEKNIDKVVYKDAKLRTFYSKDVDYMDVIGSEIKVKHAKIIVAENERYCDDYHYMYVNAHYYRFFEKKIARMSISTNVNPINFFNKNNEYIGCLLPVRMNDDGRKRYKEEMSMQELNECLEMYNEFIESRTQDIIEKCVEENKEDCIKSAEQKLVDFKDYIVSDLEVIKNMDGYYEVGYRLEGLGELYTHVSILGTKSGWCGYGEYQDFLTKADTKRLCEKMLEEMQAMMQEEVVEVKKEIEITIDGEGRVEKITTNSVEDASKNLVRRIAEIKGEKYCNKTWITIDVEEFEEPIEFRVDLIERLHGNINNVLELIIEEKERECKYVSENKERCTWIKDTDKFIAVRQQVVEVLKKYLQPKETKFIELTEDVSAEKLMEMAKEYTEEKVEEEMKRVEVKTADITKAMKKIGDFLKVERSEKEIYDMIWSIYPNACEIDYREEDKSISFIAGVDFAGAKPTKKRMLEIDENFARVEKMEGLMLNIYQEKEKIKMSADVMVTYADKWGYEDSYDVVVKEMEVALPPAQEEEVEEIKEVEEKVEVISTDFLEEIKIEQELPNKKSRYYETKANLEILEKNNRKEGVGYERYYCNRKNV